jgi:hypothetical protein
MRAGRLRRQLGRATAVGACFAAAFAVGDATERPPSAEAVPVRAAPPAANAGVTGLGSPDALPRLLPSAETRPVPSGPVPGPIPGPTSPLPDDSSSQSPPYTAPSDPPSREPGGGNEGESQSGSL